jgi:lysozyme family protein
VSLEKALEFTLKWEGGYSDNPNDPGGETKFGISKRAHPDIDIKNLTLDEAREIYRAEYWEASGCDSLDEPMDMVVFDAAVNLGCRRAKELLNQSHGDWIHFLILRIKLYCSISQTTFLKGWINRVVDLYFCATGR